MELMKNEEGGGEGGAQGEVGEGQRMSDRVVSASAFSA